MLIMLLLVESIVMCFVLLLVCAVGIANGPVGLVGLYEADVQQRVVELGYTTKEKIRKRHSLMTAALFVPVLILPPVMVYFLNGAAGFWDGFWQMTVILLTMNLFDRLFIDVYWVGCTKAWIIPGTEDLQPYIPKKVLIRKWVGTFISFPVLAAMLAGVMTFLL